MSKIKCWIASKVFGLLFLTLFSMVLFAQDLPPGVTRIADSHYVGRGNAAFYIEDSHNILWSGLGLLNTTDKRSNGGLRKLVNGQWTDVYLTGIFTDAVNDGSKIYFSAYDGIYTCEDTAMKIDNSVTQNTALAFYKNNLWVGSMGNGLFKKDHDVFKKITVSILNKSYDSIYCLKADGNNLWIGTSDGLIKYDGKNFTKFDLPLRHTNWRSGYIRQKTVACIEKDKQNRIWVLTRNQADSLECLYLLKNGSFISARKYYASNCYLSRLIPFRASKIAVNRAGNIIIGMSWGFLEFAENIKPTLATPNIGWNDNTSSSVIYCNSKGKIISYFNLTGLSGNDGIFEIDPDKYSIEDMEHIIYKNKINFNTIDVNDIKAMMANDGIMFDGIIDPIESFMGKPNFNIPSVGCASPMFLSGLWIGGFDESSGNLHLAAQTYRITGSDFLTGPIDLVTKKYDSTANSFYNKIWKIDRKTIEEFRLNLNKPFYSIPAEILDWPAHGKGNFAKNLAPFVDTDSNGAYEPAKGDYPKIKGDQMLWWVFNDLGLHGETNGKSLGMEIHGSCYAYYHKDLLSTDSNALVNRTIFFDYKFINRSGFNYKELYAGIFNDVDLGNYNDDLVGCDTIQNVGFGYNGDNFDEGPRGFGKNPPMIFCKFLNQRMSNFISYYNNFTDLGNPTLPIEYYAYLRSSSKKNDPDFNSVGFINQGYPCSNPYNEKDKKPGDRRFLMATNTPLLKKDSTFELEFAYIFLHDTIDFLKEGCDKPFKSLKKIQSWYDHNNFPSKPFDNSISEQVKVKKGDFIIFPNPASGRISLCGGIENKDIHATEIIDGCGKSVLQSNIIDKTGFLNTTLDVSSISGGMYFLRIITAEGAITRKFIKM